MAIQTVLDHDLNVNGKRVTGLIEPAAPSDAARMADVTAIAPVTIVADPTVTPPGTVYPAGTLADYGGTRYTKFGANNLASDWVLTDTLKNLNGFAPNADKAVKMQRWALTYANFQTGDNSRTQVSLHLGVSAAIAACKCVGGRIVVTTQSNVANGVAFWALGGNTIGTINHLAKLDTHPTGTNSMGDCDKDPYVLDMNNLYVWIYCLSGNVGALNAGAFTAQVFFE